MPPRRRYLLPAGAARTQVALSRAALPLPCGLRPCNVPALCQQPARGSPALAARRPSRSAAPLAGPLARPPRRRPTRPPAATARRPPRSPAPLAGPIDHAVTRQGADPLGHAAVLHGRPLFACPGAAQPDRPPTGICLILS